ncbi:MAG TPA: hypothetical protein VGM73_16275 [Candidatus Didemnitutus sp.]
MKNDESEAAASRKTYRDTLLSLQEKMQAEYDKALLTLSGGAFGLSALIIKDLIGTDKAKGSLLLLIAWVSWATSMLAVIASFFTSTFAMEKAVKQTDEGTIARENAGGIFNCATQLFNITSGSAFFLGVIFFSFFLHHNL